MTPHLEHTELDAAVAAVGDIRTTKSADVVEGSVASVSVGIDVLMAASVGLGADVSTTIPADVSLGSAMPTFDDTGPTLVLGPVVVATAAV